jgi:hypothetical protein
MRLLEEVRPLRRWSQIKGTVLLEKMDNMEEDAKERGHDAGVKNNSGKHRQPNATDIDAVGASCQS